ncbi:hypothetical protein EUTSA_v10012406mg [Eutrema salsugineum]|uniref:Secreted protein n=1 Tax=Eutrema salsugineum TaxID=72664 RepID=V4KLA7_EUTSA|nr:hypothetical protein EUTSA_v10012406mg [Eutrema salsugineum]
MASVELCVFLFLYPLKSLCLENKKEYKPSNPRLSLLSASLFENDHYSLDLGVTIRGSDQQKHPSASRHYTMTKGKQWRHPSALI